MDGGDAWPARPKPSGDIVISQNWGSENGIILSA
jgi:hypothetical protein